MPTIPLDNALMCPSAHSPSKALLPSQLFSPKYQGSTPDRCAPFRVLYVVSSIFPIASYPSHLWKNAAVRLLIRRGELVFDRKPKIRRKSSSKYNHPWKPLPCRYLEVKITQLICEHSQ
jgi:hypothetical protein